MDKLHDFRPAWLEVDLDNLIYNTRLFKEIIGEDVKLIATIKGNLYGAGVEHTARIIQENGADEFAVATLSEAIELRKFGITKPILILGYTPHNQYKYLFEYDITPNIYDLEDAKSLSEVAESLGKKKKIHVKLDTGMTRVGLDCSDESVDKVCEIAKLPGLELEGLFTHFTSSEEKDKSKTFTQAEKFVDFYDRVKAKGVEIPVRHLSNSAATIELPQLENQAVRVGYSIAGYYSGLEIDHTRAELKPIMQLKAKIVRVQEVPKGTTVGYNCTYTVENENAKIATLPIGYADGYKRAFSNLATVLVNGKRAPIRGLICMDQMMIDVSDIDCKVGDEVTLFGYQYNAPTVYEICELANCSDVDLVCGIARRVPRVYLKNKEIVAVQDYLLDQFEL